MNAEMAQRLQCSFKTLPWRPQIDANHCLVWRFSHFAEISPSRHTSEPFRSIAPEASVKVFCRITAQPLPTVGGETLAFLLRSLELLLQLVGTGVDDLKLSEMRVEHADNLGELF